MKPKYLISLIIMLALALLSLQIVRAQDQPSQEPSTDEQDQSAPGVARVGVVQGNVSTMIGDGGQWAATSINAPIQRGDSISTGDNSRTEIQLDYANVLRLDEHTQANVADLTRSRIQLQLSQGNANYDVMDGNEAEAEIDTPNVAVHPNQAGSYRIEVDPDSGSTIVIVRKGEAEVSTPQGSTTVEEGQMITIQGKDNPEYQVNDAPARDQWDQWNQDRDNEILNAQSWKHTDKYYTGTQDLDRNGRWKDVPGYGDVWTPDAGPDWTPYQDGRWVWEPYYGWTWVSDEPWGWAPYHYGRWFLYDDSWYWWPGPVYSGYYPVWSPAYVSFFGFGWGHFSFGFGYRSIGWCPLGPHDSYYPWYGRGFNNGYSAANLTFGRDGRYLGGSRIGRALPPLARGGRYPRMSNIQAAFNNPRATRGFTTVSAQDFRNGRVPRNATRINSSELRQGRMIQGGIPVAPTRQSFSPTGRMVERPASASRGQTFFSQSRGMGATRSFSPRNSSAQFTNRGGFSAAPRSGWQRFGGASSPRVFTNDNVPGRRGGSGQFSRIPGQAGPGARPAPANGWQRFSQHPNPAPRTQGSFSAPRSQQAPSGWNRFSSRPGNSSAPRANPRFPLGRNKPIVTQRAPRENFGSQSAPPRSNFGGRTAPPAPRGDFGRQSAPPRSFFGGRTAPPPREFNGGGRYEAPPRSNFGGRAAPPPREFNGGGRYEAPPRSFNGGRSEAPARGNFGGGRSAPAPSYRGGGNGGGGSFHGGGGGGKRSGGSVSRGDHRH